MMMKKGMWILLTFGLMIPYVQAETKAKTDTSTKAKADKTAKAKADKPTKAKSDGPSCDDKISAIKQKYAKLLEENKTLKSEVASLKTGLKKMGEMLQQLAPKPPKKAKKETPKKPRTPAVAIAVKDVKGALSKDAVMAAHRRIRQSYIHCYRTLIKHNPKASGNVTLTYTLQANGRLSSPKDIQLQSKTLTNKSFQKCLRLRVLAGSLYFAMNKAKLGGKAAQIKVSLAFRQF